MIMTNPKVGHTEGVRQFKSTPRYYFDMFVGFRTCLRLERGLLDNLDERGLFMRPCSLSRLGPGNVLRDWLNGKAQEFLKSIGLRRGHKVLDFGCGRGNYTIPAAQVVGNEGRVYALDKNPRSLDELMRRAAARDLDNIVRMDTLITSSKSRGSRGSCRRKYQNMS